MLQLNKLKKTMDRRKRVGRGGKLGGTSGKGNKGQLARSGPKIRPLFEGGQMPLFRRLPKRGFSNERFALNYEIVNISELERVFNNDEEVTIIHLIDKGLVKVRKNGKIKVLGNGDLSKRLKVHAHAFSASAVAAIEKAKGEVHVVAKEK